MKALCFLAICVALTALTGCAEPDHYPLSGQACSPEDPVQDLAAGDCLPPV